MYGNRSLWLSAEHVHSTVSLLDPLTKKHQNVKFIENKIVQILKSGKKCNEVCQNVSIRIFRILSCWRWAIFFRYFTLDCESISDCYRRKKRIKWIQFSDIHIYPWKNVCVMRRESYWKFRMPHFDRIFDLGMRQMWSSLFWVPVWRLPIDVNFSIKINSIHSRMIIEIIISTSVCAQNHIEMIYNMWVKISYTIINKLLFMKCS